MQCSCSLLMGNVFSRLWDNTSASPCGFRSSPSNMQQPCVVGIVTPIFHVGEAEVQWVPGTWLRLHIKAAAGLETRCLMSSFAQNLPLHEPNFVHLVLYGASESKGDNIPVSLELLLVLAGAVHPHRCGGEKGLPWLLCINFDAWYLNDIIESQVYLWNTAMLHSSVP